eukprot:399283-Rhodomonas_salina.8
MALHLGGAHARFMRCVCRLSANRPCNDLPPPLLSRAFPNSCSNSRQMSPLEACEAWPMR